MCTSHSDLVSFGFYAILIFHIHLLVKVQKGIYHCTTCMCTSHSDLVSFTNPIFHILIYLIDLITIPSLLTILVQVSMLQAAKKKTTMQVRVVSTLYSMQSATCTQIHVWEICMLSLSHISVLLRLEPHHTFPVQCDR